MPPPSPSHTLGQPALARWAWCPLRQSWRPNGLDLSLQALQDRIHSSSRLGESAVR